MRKIAIHAGEVSVTAVLDSSPTADAIWDALPLEARANTWGMEIYFSIPVELSEAEDAREEVPMGSLGYWPTGNAFCIFFGPTPASRGHEIRAASPVNLFGSVEGDATLLASVPGGALVRVERLEGQGT